MNPNIILPVDEMVFMCKSVGLQNMESIVLLPTPLFGRHGFSNLVLELREYTHFPSQGTIEKVQRSDFAVETKAFLNSVGLFSGCRSWGNFSA
jgi:hypothetical protein